MKRFASWWNPVLALHPHPPHPPPTHTHTPSTTRQPNCTPLVEDQGMRQHKGNKEAFLPTVQSSEQARGYLS